VSELQGKNVSMLMGPPASSHHNQYLQRYKKTGDLLGFRALVSIALCCRASLVGRGAALPVTSGSHTSPPKEALFLAQHLPGRLPACSPACLQASAR